MSTQIKEVLTSILFTTDESCFLCFASVETANASRMSDEIMYKDKESTKKVLEMLTAVLGLDVTQHASNNDPICDNCLQMCISAYQFIEASKWNVNLMLNLINNLTSSISDIEDADFCNSAFLSVNPYYNSSLVYLEKEAFPNVKKALSKFRVLVKRSTIKDYLCNMCYKEFSTLEQANAHSEQCLGTGRYNFDMGADSPTHSSDTKIKIEKDEPCIIIAPNNFQCKECLKEFTTFFKLQSHCKKEHEQVIENSGIIVEKKNKMSYMVLTQDNENLYQCSQCMQTYTTYHSLQRHYMRTHNKHLNINKVERCAVCGETFKTKSLWRNHQAIHYTISTPNDIKTYKCNQCNAQYTLYHSLIRHFRLAHDKSRPIKLPVRDWRHFKKTHTVKAIRSEDQDGIICVVCEKAFEKRSLWRSHQETHFNIVTLNDTELYKCNICRNTFSQYHSVIRHFKRVHNNAGIIYKPKPHGGILCTVCGKTFKNTAFLRKHEETHEPKKITCDKCKKSYRCEYSYKKHLCNPNNVRLIRDRKLECDYCGKRYSQRLGLQTHIRYMHLSEGIFCSVCNKRFATKQILQEHLLVHTKEKNFECSVCGGKFCVKAALKTHMRLHTGETPYPCDLCGMKFISSSRRADHIRRKHEERKIMCDICSKKFYLPKDLARHRSRHFNNKSSLYMKSNRRQNEF